MNRKAFLLGFFSIGGQVLLLRELVASFNGDELFIGTALFGWLIAVACGAYIGGRQKSKITAHRLFILGAIFLPASIIMIRLSLRALGLISGEIVPFSTAALISIILTFPTGLISGALFPAISREGYRPSATVNRVYLFEGIGAFVGGIVITALVGWVFSSLAMALGLGVITLILNFMPLRGKAIYILSAFSLFLLLLIKYTAPSIDRYLDAIRYSSYEVVASFDTHYGHQTIISRDSTVILLTDNTVEATCPDLISAENSIIPPLLYKPDTANILIIGRTEFGIDQITGQMPELKITELDPRVQLTTTLGDIFNEKVNVTRVEDDPVRYMRGHEIFTKYDIIIMTSVHPDNYKSNRLLTDQFLIRTKRMLKPDGVLFICTNYDTDRYISGQKQDVISSIYRTLENSYMHTLLWPGTSTLFFASDDSLFNIPIDTLLSRIEHLTYRPQFISTDYLPDRLSQFKTQRLYNAVGDRGDINGIDKPSLIYRQAILSSMASSTDKAIAMAVFLSLYPAMVVPLLLLLFFGIVVRHHPKHRTYALFLYFMAGLFSLSAELISFYLYQSTAGSLYSEMGLLIGAFMLGLAGGTYFSVKSDSLHLEYPSLLLALTSIILFFATYSRIPLSVLLVYHTLFLLTTAMATGALFVAATRRYYYGRSESNRGAGYACEIVGSSMGALFTITILLPLIGIKWLLIAIIIVLVLCLVGAYVTE